MNLVARNSQLRTRLLARIERRFVTRTEEMRIGPLRLPFTRVKDPDTVLDQIVEAEDARERSGERREGNALHLPYWAELWDSAIGVAEYLATTLARRPSGTTLRVLDLGCGMGLTGMTAAAMGADVLLADLESDALLFARLNTLRWRDRVRVRQVDWQADRLSEQFDLIIGADVLYDKTQWEFLDPFFDAHVAKHGTILLGEPGRPTGDLFQTWITERNWLLEMSRIRPPGGKDIRLLRLARARG